MDYALTRIKSKRRKRKPLSPRGKIALAVCLLDLSMIVLNVLNNLSGHYLIGFKAGDALTGADRFWSVPLVMCFAFWFNMNYQIFKEELKKMWDD